MKLHRSSIAMTMWVVVIVALDLAAGRVIYQFLPWRLAGVLLIGVVIQVGLGGLFCSRSRQRLYAFWAGLELGGLAGLTSFLYARVPGSWVGSLWDSYALYVDDLLRARIGFSVLNRGPEDLVFLITVAVFAFLPQLLVALAGGALGLSLGWSARSRRSVFTLVFILFEIAGMLVFDFAVWSALPAQPPWLLVGVTPGCVLLQLGLYAAIRSRRRPRPRAFWAGFATAVSIVFWSYFRAMVFAPMPTARYLTYWAGGPAYARPIPVAPLWGLWINYTTLASYALGRPPYGTFLVEWTHGPIDSLVYFLIVLLPHLLAAAGGGTLALFLTRLADFRRMMKRAGRT